MIYRPGCLLIFAGVFLLVSGDVPVSGDAGRGFLSVLLKCISSSRMYLVLLFVGIVLELRHRPRTVFAKANIGNSLFPLLAAVGVFLNVSFSTAPLTSLHALGFYGVVLLTGFLPFILTDDTLIRKYSRVAVQLGLAVLTIKILLVKTKMGILLTQSRFETIRWEGKQQIAWVLSLTLAVWFRGNRIVGMLAFGMAAVMLALLFSKSALLALLVQSIVVLVCIQKKFFKGQKIWPYVTIGLAVVLGGMIVYKQSPDTKGIFTRSADVRFEIWKETLTEIFPDHWLTGTGLGTFDIVAYEQYPRVTTLYDPGRVFYGRGWHAHNIFIHLLAETGLIGLMTLVWGIIVMVKKILELPVIPKRDLIVMLSGFLVLASFDALILYHVHESFRMGVLLFILTGIFSRDVTEAGDR